MRITWTRVLLVLLALILLVFGAAFTRQNTTTINRWLEDATGETSMARQLNALAWKIVQRETDTADFVPVTYASVYPYGANTFFEQEVEEWKLRRSMEMLRAAGVRWVRQQMPWDRIELAKGNYDSPFGGSTWDSYDRFIALAREYDLEIMARLDLPPEWARREPFEWEQRTLPQAAPRDLNDYGDFVEAFVSRYRGQIRYYQIWNEPNLFSDWGEAIDAWKYTEMLRIASTRARQANPDVVIVTAAIAATNGTPDGFNQDDLSFIQQMYIAGAAPYFDILATQGHGLWTGPGNPRSVPSETNFARLELIREIMVRNGDAHKAIWVSELGWNAQPLDHPLPPSHGRVTQEQQARYTVQAYQRAQREWPWIGVMFYWHFRRVHDENRAEVDFYYRMVDPDFVTHPVYWAYADMAAQVPFMGIGFHQEDHWAIDYQGNWRVVNSPLASLGQARAGTPGDRLAVQFEGTDLQLAQLAQPQGGRARYSISDAATGRTLQSGTVDFRTPGAPTPRIVTLAERLPSSRYQLTLEVESGTVEIDAFIVRSNPLAFLAPAFAVVGLGGALVVLVLVFLLGKRRPTPA